MEALSFPAERRHAARGRESICGDSRAFFTDWVPLPSRFALAGHDNI
jgi:hypothetical protein